MMKKITLFIAVLLSFITNSNAQFAENFDAATTLPVGWSIINQGGTGTWNFGAPDGFPGPPAHSGTNVAKITYNSTAHDDYLITPQITPVSGVNDRISFWVRNGESTFYNDHYDVRLSTTDATLSANFSTVLIPDSASPANWTKVIVDLTPYIGQPIYVAIRALSTDQLYLFIDDVSNDTAPTVGPPCDSVLTSPLDGAIAVEPNGNIAWSSATGDPTGYNLTVGTTPGNNDVLPTTDVGNVTAYALGQLLESQTYYVTIEPYNVNGSATTPCTEYSFTTRDPLPPGFTCNNPIIVTLPYTTTDDTANYGADYITGAPGGGCGSTASYLGGNDVVYSYTATSDTSIKLIASGLGTYVGMFIYGSCADIGVNCLGGGVNGFAGGNIAVNEFPVVNGNTYYIVLSTWPSPQTTAYTLTINENTCVNSTSTYLVVSDCDNGPQFYVDVNITDLGSASSLTISDDQASATQSASAVGTYTFGPYANGTSVIFTVANDQDTNCVFVSSPQGQNVCPPINNLATGAIDLTLDLGTACGANQITNISNEGTSGSPEIAPSCISQYNPSNGNGDLWYKFVAPSTSVAINVTDIGGGIFTVSGAIYSGTPGALVEVGDCGNAWPKNYTTLIQGDTYYVRVWDYGNDGIGTFSLCGYYLNCVNATATYAVVSDCVNGPQFNVDVNITDLGSATSLTVSDDQGSATQSASATGIVTFGPYSNGTPVIFTITNDQDSTCFLTSASQTQEACPGPNDDLCNATALTVNATSTGTDYSCIGATAQTNEPVPTCFSGGIAGSVWFSFVATSPNATVTTDIPGGTLTDTEIAVYAATGVTCTDLSTLGAAIGCDQDSGINVLYSSILNLTGLTTGDTYYIQVDRYSGANNGTFGIEVNDSSLANSTFDTANFAYYPNPVKDVLNLSYNKSISNVEVYNLLGQQVFAKIVNATNSQIDMSNLPSGNYLVKVTADNQTKTLKVIKE